MKTPSPPTKPAAGKADSRKARLAAALKANIARRKAQAAGRDGKDNNSKDGQG